MYVQTVSIDLSFEYIKAFRDQAVSLIFLHNPKNPSHENHAFILVGPIAPSILDSALITGKKDTIVNPKNETELQAFLQAQLPECILVDPFLGFACPANTETLPEVFLTYCQTEHLTHVIGVKLYQSMLGLNETDVLTVIEDNARQLAEQIKAMLPPNLQNPIGIPNAVAHGALFQPPQAQSREQKVAAIIEKYTINGKSINEEQALRRAAFKGNLQDIKTLVAFGVNIDAAGSGKTALDWAIKENHPAVVDFLTQIKTERAQLDSTATTAKPPI